MKRQLQYSLYRRPRNARVGTRWESISDVQLRKQSAIRWFQNLLILNSLGEHDSDFEYRLRPVSN